MDKSAQYHGDETMPTVWIYASFGKEQEHIRSIQFGLEEEGIPCQVKEVQEGSAHFLSIEAAKSSSLGVGIGLVESEKNAVLHHRDLPDSRKLFEIKGMMFNNDVLRKLGANSARFVKRIPLIPLVEQQFEYSDGIRCEDPKTSLMSGLQEDRIDVEILTSIVVGIMRTLNFRKEGS